MKTSKKLALVGAAGLALAGLLAYAQPGQPNQGSGDRPPGPPPGKMFGQMLLGLLTKYDVNQDGVLDQTELAALRQDIKDNKIGPPKRDGGPGGKNGPPPPLTASQVLEKFDADKDGKLDENELTAFLEDMAAHRPPPPPGFGRPGGHGPSGPGGPPPGDGSGNPPQQ